MKFNFIRLNTLKIPQLILVPLHHFQSYQLFNILQNKINHILFQFVLNKFKTCFSSFSVSTFIPLYIKVNHIHARKKKEK